MEEADALLKGLETSWTYVTSHVIEIAGLIVAYLSLVIPIRQYIGQRKLEEKDKRFNNYHRLIKELVDADDQPFIHRQMAVVFELRNYPEYHSITKRVLTSLQVTWGNTGHKDILREIQITLDFIEKT